MVGNPVNLVDINNDVGREYMNALLDAMKKINGGQPIEVESAMARLEKAFTVVQQAIKDAPPAMKKPLSQKQVSEAAAEESDQPAPAPEPPAPVSPEPPQPKPEPASPPPAPPIPKPVPEEPKPTPPPEPAPTPATASPAVPSPVQKGSLRSLADEVRLERKEAPASQVQEPPAPPKQVNPSDGLAARLAAMQAGGAAAEAAVQQESVDSVVPEPPAAAPPPPPAPQTPEEKKEPAPAPPPAPAPTPATPPPPVAVSADSQKQVDSPLPTKIPNQDESVDSLGAGEVTEGLHQLLSEWVLFKSSGLFGTGPSGKEHPLFIKLAPLSVTNILEGRYDGAKPEIKQSITDYMNGWRYEQGVIYQPGETFEHYLRRVIRHILDSK